LLIPKVEAFLSHIAFLHEITLLMDVRGFLPRSNSGPGPLKQKRSGHGLTELVFGGLVLSG
jgi:hypothetical protein